MFRLWLNFEGANAHAILESAEDSQSHAHASMTVDALLVLGFSAKTEFSLDARVLKFRSVDNSLFHMKDLAYSLSNHLSQLERRGFIIAQSSASFKDITLENLQRLPPNSRASGLPLAFVFTGQGAQWANVGLELLDKYSCFQNSLKSLDDVLMQLQHPPPWKIQGGLL